MSTSSLSSTRLLTCCLFLVCTVSQCVGEGVMSGELSPKDYRRKNVDRKSLYIADGPTLVNPEGEDIKLHYLLNVDDVSGHQQDSKRSSSAIDLLLGGKKKKSSSSIDLLLGKKRSGAAIDLLLGKKRSPYSY